MIIVEYDEVMRLLVYKLLYHLELSNYIQNTCRHNSHVTFTNEC